MNRRLGSVPYLNARPLVAWFTDTPEGRASGFEVVEAPPSELAAMLERGEIECGLLSSIEAFRPGYGYVDGIGISADGPVESVRLFSKVPVADIGTVALDMSSKTSVALTRLLLETRRGLCPEYAVHRPDAEAMLGVADAALLIGDRGFNPVAGVSEVLDLGADWKDWTGLPFVYALWVGRSENLDRSLEDAVGLAKDWGLARLDELARTYAQRHATNEERAAHYLNEVMCYGWGASFEAGLGRFRELVLEKHLQPGTKTPETTSV